MLAAASGRPASAEAACCSTSGTISGLAANCWIISPHGTPGLSSESAEDGAAPSSTVGDTATAATANFSAMRCMRDKASPIPS